MPIIYGTDNPEIIDDATNDNDVIFGYGGSDAIFGFGGDDEIIGGAGADSINGGPGSDTASYGDSETGVTVSLATDTGFGGTAEGDTLISIENLTGSFHDDLLIGDNGNNVLQGLEGTDILKGGGGADSLYGHSGNDRLKGGGGADVLDGGTGNDSMLGGTGNDTYHVDSAGDVITEVAGQGAQDRVQTSVTYTLAAGTQVEILETTNAAATTALDLVGNEFDNTIIGNDGINVIVGGLGIDTLQGNGGADAFLWSSVGEIGLLNPDIVADYSSAQGDVLHFTNIDADETLADDQNFTFIGPAAFTAAGQINWFSNGTDTIIQLNTNADPAADAVVLVSGVPTGDSVLMFL